MKKLNVYYWNEFPDFQIAVTYSRDDKNGFIRTRDVTIQSINGVSRRIFMPLPLKNTPFGKWLDGLNKKKKPKKARKSRKSRRKT